MIRYTAFMSKTDFLNTQVAGSKSGKPTLVLIHGVAGSLHIWDPVYDDLCQRYRVVRIDLLGYGHSPKPRLTYTPETHVEAIRRTLRAHDIQPPYTLVGLSMGVTLVLSFAALYPDEVDSLVAIGFPYYHDQAAARAGLKNNLWAGLTITHPLFARFFVPTAWWLGRIGIIPSHLFTKIYSPLMAHDTLLNPYRVFRSNIFNCMIASDADRLLRDSADMRRLFIHGGRDAWSPGVNVKAAVAPYAHSEFVEIPDAEHNLVVLEPARIIALVEGFVDAAHTAAESAILKANA